MTKNGITLLSSHDPESRCRKVADAVAIKDKTLYFCPSVLYGYGLDVFSARLEKEAPNSAVLCIEADSELNEQLAVSSEQLIDSLCYARDKIYFTQETDPEKLCALVREQWGARAFRRLEMVKFTGGWQLYPELYNSLFETLAREIALEWSNALTLTKLGRLYIRNLLHNLSLISNWKSIGELSFGDYPVLVLGAGPSLDDKLDSLVQKKDCKIICVDTCLGALKDRGITPDLVVVLESQHWNLRDFVGCRGWNVPVAFDMSALPQSSNVLTGQGYLYFTPWTELAIFKRMKNAGLLPDEVPPLGSVGLTAMHIARALTTGSITHAGFDFCFSIDKSHARGTPSHKEKLNTHNRFGGLLNTAAFREGVIREGNNYTNPVMKRYKEMFGRENLAQRRGRTKGSGAEIAGKNLKEFINSEIERLIELRDILVGKREMIQGKLDMLIKECDYLWAHFPDYAGGIKPNLKDISFLNRTRVEIDSILKILNNSA